MLLRLLRQAAAVLRRELGTQYRDELVAQPGRLLFPKRIHELGSIEPDAPDGLSLDHIRLAVARNAAAEEGEGSAVAALADHVTREIGEAVLLERRILARLTAP